MVEPISMAISLIMGIKKAIDKVRKTIDSFNTEYDELISNLDCLAPRLEAVKKFDDEIADLSKKDKLTVKRRTEMKSLVRHLKKCEKLVKKCEHLRSWEYVMISLYTDKLKRCNEVLEDFVTTRMVADIWVEVMTNRRVTYEWSVPKPPPFTVGWTEAVAELKQKLFQEEVRAIGICGPGGCGKSTLAKMLCEQVKGNFDRISYICIARSPDSPTEKKEKEKLNWIAMFNKLWDDLVAGPKPSEFESREGALELLKRRLAKRKTQGKGLLVVLDGVWSDNMLEKFEIGTPGLKTLVTSREQLKDLKWSYPVPQLTMEDAKNVFLHYAQLEGQIPEHVDDELVKQIVEGCKFYPLALKVVGASLKNTDVSKWETTAENLHKKGHIFKEHEEEIFWPLYTSLKSLTETQRECLMDLSSFPDNKRIRAAALMDMWVHIRGQDEKGADNILKELADRHLIELFQRTWYETRDLEQSFSNLFVAQHDILTELAVYVNKHSEEGKSNMRLIINKGDTLPDPVKEKDTISQAQIVSIHNRDSVNFDWTDVQLPGAEVLILNFSTSPYCLPQFMNSMKNLKVLIIANHNMAAAELSGLPPSGSLNALRVVRLEKISLPVPGTSMETFRGVQKLSMILCKVNEVLDICSGFDIETMFPDLTELEIDYCNGLERLPNSVCNIVNLQKLSVTNCHDLSELPEEIDTLSKLEVLRLSACTSLEKLPNSLSELKKLRFLDLSCCSRIEHLPKNIGMLRSLEMIDFKGCLLKQPDMVINLEGLKHVICDEDAKGMWERDSTNSRRPRVHGRKELLSLNFLK